MIAATRDLELANPILDSPRQKRALTEAMPPGSLRRLAAKEHLFLEGDKKTHIFQVTSGTVAIYRILQDGRRQILRFALPGDVIGLGWMPEESCSAQATRGAVVKCVPAAALRRAAERDPRFGRLVCEALVMELDATCDHLVSLGQNDGNARVARFVISMLERAESRGAPSTMLQLTMTRADIGDHLGLTLESVSRAFSHFKRCGIIDIERAVNIHVLDRAGLELAATGGKDA